jgi:hypothetical protein
MTAHQFRAALDKLELSTEEAAKFFGISRPTAFRYANGTSRVPGAIARLLQIEVERCMVRCYGTKRYQAYRDGKPVGPMVESSARAYALALDL